MKKILGLIVIVLILLLSFSLVSCTSGGSSGVQESSEQGDNTPSNNTNTSIYTITWKNWDGTTLETDENVPFGTTPLFNGNQPTKEEDSQYTYTFNGWSPSISSVSANTTYTAQFTQNRKAITISFNLNNGTTTSDTSSREIISLDSSYFFFNVTKENYNFRGWSYKGTKVFDQNGNLINNVALENDMVFDAIFIQGVTLTINYTLYEPRTNTRVNTFSNLDGSVGTGSGTRDYSYNTNVDLSVSLNEGYEFVGWYYNGSLLSSETEYNYMMWDEDITLEGRIKYKYYSLNIYSNNSFKGLVLIGKSGNPNDYGISKNGTKYFTESITISAYTRTDTRFLGWYDENNELVSTNGVYTFTMPNRNYTLEAKWNYFTISYNLGGGTNDTRNPDSYVLEDGNITLYNPTRNGYTFVGWYLDDTPISNFDSQLVKHITLEARWTYYTLTTTRNNISAGSITSYDNTKITAGESVSITATANTGYTFVGWYNDDTLLTNNATYTFNMPETVITYEARFNVSTYTVTIDNQASGVTIIGAGTYAYGTQVTLVANNISNGWYLIWSVNNGNIVNIGSSYAFIMGLEDVTIVTTLKVYTRENNVIYFGSYPKTEVKNETLISLFNSNAGELPTSTNSYSWTDYGYYISGEVSSYMWYQDVTYNNNKYRGVYFKSYRPYLTTSSSSTGNSYQDNNGYTTSTTYWFKFEPIKWNILQESSGKALLIADLLLDSQDYYWSNSSSSHSHNGGTGYSNNYELSHIRQWLNNTFYDTAFTSAQQAIIQTTNVDNSVSSTGYSTNQYACSNTTDKIFLLSYSEATTYYSSDSARQAIGSDYAKCQGLYVYNSTGKSYWWLRSSYSGYSYCARDVKNDGSIDYGNVIITGYGVRPAMWINL